MAREINRGQLFLNKQKVGWQAVNQKIKTVA